MSALMVLMPLLHQQARIEAFQAALSELVMFKSKTDVALLQVCNTCGLRAAARQQQTLPLYGATPVMSLPCLLPSMLTCSGH